MLSVFRNARAEIPGTRALNLPLSIGRIGAKWKRRRAARKSQVAASPAIGFFFFNFDGKRTEAATTEDSLEADCLSVCVSEILTDAAADADEALRETEPREGAVGC